MSDDRDEPGPAPDARELLRSAWRRSAKLATLPLSFAGRATVGFGQRLGGAPPEVVRTDLQRKAADQLFRVLGELKGGAMKLGQALSLFEAMLPSDVAGQYRTQLRRLQDSAPPMPASRVHAVLARELGPQWRTLFDAFSDQPAAAASIGQVHRATWAADGREVAVKVQYPGADDALRSDLRQLSRLATAIAPLAGGIDVKPLADELASRISEEVDYELEAAHAQQAADGFVDDPEFVVPQVVAHTRRVLVTEWIEGTRFADVADRPEPERNRAGLAYVRFLFAGPRRVGLLHADPHPGNFKMMPDGRLGVVDFGLVARMPHGLPEAMGRLLSIAASGDAAQVASGLADEGFIAKPIAPDDLLAYLAPFVEPATVAEFHFTRDWMQQQYRRISDPATAGGIAVRLNLPPEYLLIHRVWLGGIAVLSQLDVRARFADVLTEFLPGFSHQIRS